MEGTKICFIIQCMLVFSVRHVMYTIVDRYDNERETWSKSR